MDPFSFNRTAAPPTMNDNENTIGYSQARNSSITVATLSRSRHVFKHPADPRRPYPVDSSDALSPEHVVVCSVDPQAFPGDFLEKLPGVQEMERLNRIRLSTAARLNTRGII